jgi:hypothetical protein
VGAKAALITPPLWNCSQGSGLVNDRGSVTCSPPGLNTLTNCKEVFAAAVMLPTELVNGAATATANTNCGWLAAAATARDNGAPVIALNGRVGYGPMPVTCSWDASTAATPIAWTAVCFWDLVV